MSRRPERLADAAAAVYVITRDDIRRAGATTLPEALRLAPNLQVARTSSNSYAISARGFNSEQRQQAAGADRRPQRLHAAVLRRVLGRAGRAARRRRAHRGDQRARAARCGAPTRSTASSTSSRARRATRRRHARRRGAGNDDRGVALRYGVRWAERRRCASMPSASTHDGTVRADGAAATTHGARARRASAPTAARRRPPHPAGRRLRRRRRRTARRRPPTSPAPTCSARWTASSGRRGALRVQAYSTHSERRQPGLFSETLDTVDIEVQHQLRLGADPRHRLGRRLRHQRDHTRRRHAARFRARRQPTELANVFAQDTRRARRAAELTLGAQARAQQLHRRRSSSRTCASPGSATSIAVVGRAVARRAHAVAPRPRLADPLPAAGRLQRHARRRPALRLGGR